MSPNLFPRPVLFFLALMLVSGSALAKKPTLIVPGLGVGDGISAPLATRYETYVRGLAAKKARLLKKKQSEAAMDRASVGLPCLTEACGKKLAKAAKVRFVLGVRVANVDEIYTVTMGLYDAAHGRYASSEETCELCAADEVNGSLAAAFSKIVGGLDVPPPKPVTQAPEQPAKVALSITSVPEGAMVKVDGAEVGRTPVVTQVVQGTHEVEVLKAGFKASSRTTTAADAPLTLAFELVVVPPAVAVVAPSMVTPPVAPVTPSGGGWSSYHTAGWGMTVGGAALAGVGTWLVYLDGDITCNDGRGRTECPDVYNTKGAGAVALGVGAALIGAGATVLILNPGDDSAAPSAAATVTPGVDGGAMLQLGGRF